MTVYCNHTGCLQPRMGGSYFCTDHYAAFVKDVNSCERKCGRFAPNGEKLCGICKRGEGLNLRAKGCVIEVCELNSLPDSRYCEAHATHFCIRQGCDADRKSGSAYCTEHVPTTTHFPPMTDNEQITATVVRDIVSEGAETKETLAGGATRTKPKLRFELVPECALRRLALRFTQGAAKHGENNWRKGDFMFVVSCFGHASAHISAMREQGNQHDDNLGAALWNLAAIAWYEKFKAAEYDKALDYMERGGLA